MHHWLLIIGEMAAPAVMTKAKGSLGRNVFQLRAVFELPGGVGGVEPPYLILPTPLPLVKIRPRGGRVSTPHLSFAKVAILLDSHFLLMQFLKCLLFYSVMI